MNHTRLRTAAWLAPLLTFSPEVSSALPTQPFLWGAANAAFQVEGSPVDSDWLRWTRLPGKIADGTNADVATDFWNRYDDDFALVQQLGANAFRVSIAWERIEPSPGKWDEAALGHYEAMMLAMRARGLEPVVTLNHFVLPGWLAERGGIVASTFVSEFAAYSEKVVARLGSGPAKVRWWMTFNEPNVQGLIGYADGMWPPGKKGDFDSLLRGYANLARAHIEAARKIRALPDGKQMRLSIAHHWRVFQAKFWSPLGFLAARIAHDSFNQQLVDAMTTGKLNFSFPGAKSIHEQVSLPGGKSTLDYLGINYYGRVLMEFTFKPPYIRNSEGPGTKNDLGWEIYPEGIATALRSAYHRYRLPILITENGLADAEDRLRSRFLEAHLAELKTVSREVPVLGYLHWSLTDNFEWAYGLTPRFGLVEIDYTTLKRTPRPSFHRFAELIRNWSREPHLSGSRENR